MNLKKIIINDKQRSVYQLSRLSAVAVKGSKSAMRFVEWRERERRGPALPANMTH